MDKLEPQQATGEEVVIKQEEISEGQPSSSKVDQPIKQETTVEDSKQTIEGSHSQPEEEIKILKVVKKEKEEENPQQEVNSYQVKKEVSWNTIAMTWVNQNKVIVMSILVALFAAFLFSIFYLFVKVTPVEPKVRSRMLVEPKEFTEHALQEVLKSVATIAKTFDYSGNSTSVVTEKQFVLLLGKTSSSKSTAINFFLNDKNVRRVGEQPVDKTITIVEYGIDNKLLQGDQIFLSPEFEELKSKFGEQLKGNLAVQRTPIELLKKVSFFDTPGLGDMAISKNQTEMYEWFIQRADVIYFLINPYNFNEMSTLFEHLFKYVMEKHSEKTYLVLTRVDKHSTEQLFQLTASTTFRLGRVTKDNSKNLYFTSFDHGLCQPTAVIFHCPIVDSHNKQLYDFVTQQLTTPDLEKLYARTYNYLEPVFTAIAATNQICREYFVNGKNKKRALRLIDEEQYWIKNMYQLSTRYNEISEDTLKQILQADWFHNFKTQRVEDCELVHEEDIKVLQGIIQNLKEKGKMYWAQEAAKKQKVV